jgi:hypothetical protein
VNAREEMVSVLEARRILFHPPRPELLLAALTRVVR